MMEVKPYETIKEEKEKRLNKAFAVLSSLKNIKSFNQKPTNTFKNECFDIDKKQNDDFISITYDKSQEILTNNNIQIDNGIHMTNLSFNLNSLDMRNETIFSFTLDNNYKNDPFYSHHLTNESFIFNLNQGQKLMTVEKLFDQKKEGNEDTLLSSKKQTQEDENTILDNSEDSLDNIQIEENIKNIKPEKPHRIRNQNDHKIYCLHEDCELIFRTLKLKLAHHHKMSPECQNDTIMLIKTLGNVKVIINSLAKRKRLHKKKLTVLLKKYKQVMNSISLSEHVELFAGFSLNKK